MSQTRPPVTLSMAWDGGLRFSGRCGDLTMSLDGDAAAAPSPVHALAFGLAGCMGIDVVNILVRGRHGLQGLSVALTYARADGTPARLVSAGIQFVVTGAIPAEAVERAIQLSREKYCSVWHSMRQDIGLTVGYEIVSA